MALEIEDLKERPTPHMSVLLVGPAGFGKTTALLSAPKPLLIGDVDGGIESLFKGNVVPPAAREGVKVARITSHGDANEFLTNAWRTVAPHGTVAIDTFNWLMNMVVKPEILRMNGHELPEKRDWGFYLERGLALAKKAHELALREDGCHVILTSHEADKGGEEGEVGKLGPAISGQLFDILPGMVNYVFFLKIRATGKLDPVTKKPIMERVFQTESDHRTPAKSRRTLAQYEPPDFGAIWAKVKPA